MEEFSTALREGDEGTVLRLVDADPALLERAVHAGNRPLAVAAEYGHLGVARLLIERGVNTNATGCDRNAALHYAAMGGHEEVVALLLEKGAQANTGDVDGTTPLMLACDYGHLGVVKMLYQHVGNQGLQEKSDSGCTALHFASYAGHREVVRFLLLAGADPTIMNNRGRTPCALAEENHDTSRLAERRARCVAVFQVR
jgi:ankyrin repeat protein